MSRLLLAALLLAALAAVPASALTHGKGEAGAAFLGISPGARPAAMGDAFGGLADDVYSVYYNPAGLGGLERVQMAGSHEARFEGLSYDHAAVSVPLLAWVDTPRPGTDLGVLAFSVTSLKVEGLERRGTTETDQPLGTFDAGDLALALSYGLNLPESPWSVGATAKLIESRLDSARARAPALDVGALYRADRWSAGAGARNLGQGLRFREETDPLPSVLYAGASCELNEKWLAAAELSQPLDFAVGFERRRTFGKKLQGAGRFGYNTAKRGGGTLAGAALGLGLTYNGFSADFAWLPAGELGDGFKYTVIVKF